MEPVGRTTRWLAHRLEDAIWRFPRLTMGCRPVTTLPALEEAGAVVELEKRIGNPLLPFIVYAVRKPQ